MSDMTVCNVLSTLPIGEDTAVVVGGSRELFKNGTGILDEKGKPYEVLSVGMDENIETEDVSNRASLLIKGSFASTKLFV